MYFCTNLFPEFDTFSYYSDENKTIFRPREESLAFTTQIFRRPSDRNPENLSRALLYNLKNNLRALSVGLLARDLLQL